MDPRQATARVWVVDEPAPAADVTLENEDVAAPGCGHAGRWRRAGQPQPIRGKPPLPARQPHITSRCATTVSARTPCRPAADDHSPRRCRRFGVHIPRPLKQGRLSHGWRGHAQERGHDNASQHQFTFGLWDLERLAVRWSVDRSYPATVSALPGPGTLHRVGATHLGP